jgi:hypothetical protein
MGAVMSAQDHQRLWAPETVFDKSEAVGAGAARDRGTTGPQYTGASWPRSKGFMDWWKSRLTATWRGWNRKSGKFCLIDDLILPA